MEFWGNAVLNLFSYENGEAMDARSGDWAAYLYVHSSTYTNGSADHKDQQQQMRCLSPQRTEERWALSLCILS